mmetsp:Transcript_4871/g.12052  ORF Transcript_4871/g.12052 Transcript_4871/m.12052 type:complete len:215 (+) Transcript_4871:1132-1776(+)
MPMWGQYHRRCHRGETRGLARVPAREVPTYTLTTGRAGCWRWMDRGMGMPRAGIMKRSLWTTCCLLTGCIGCRCLLPPRVGQRATPAFCPTTPPARPTTTTSITTTIIITTTNRAAPVRRTTTRTRTTAGQVSTVAATTMTRPLTAVCKRTTTTTALAPTSGTTSFPEQDSSRDYCSETQHRDLVPPAIRRPTPVQRRSGSGGGFCASSTKTRM